MVSGGVGSGFGQSRASLATQASGIEWIAGSGKRQLREWEREGQTRATGGVSSAHIYLESLKKEQES